MNTNEESLKRLNDLIIYVPELVNEIPANEFDYKGSADRWSRKEILGHLIDSASVNHHRLIRSQFEHIPSITYDQVKWVMYNAYQHSGKENLIALWTMYNKHIGHIVAEMPTDMKLRLCNTGAVTLTLEDLFNDYVDHLDHHVKQLQMPG